MIKEVDTLMDAGGVSVGSAPHSSVRGQNADGENHQLANS